MTTPWRWSVNMYSFTNELMEGDRTPDELLADIVAAKLVDGVEIESPQHFSTFPHISPEQIRTFRETVDATGVTPVLMAGYRDIRIDTRGRRTVDEDVELVMGQITAAKELGFMGVRMGMGSVPTEVLTRVVPQLEKLDIILLEEVQGGARPDSPMVNRNRELRATLDTDRLGILVDTSLMMVGVPVTWAASLRRDGVPQAMLDEIEALWMTRDAQGWEKKEALIAPLTLPGTALKKLDMPFRRWGCSTVAEWSEFLDATISVHLKYWDLDDEGGRVSGPTREIYDALLASGYSGFVCSEWGGHDWLEADEASAFDMTRGHREIFEGSL